MMFMYNFKAQHTQNFVLLPFCLSLVFFMNENVSPNMLFFKLCETFSFLQAVELMVTEHEFV